MWGWLQFLALYLYCAAVQAAGPGWAEQVYKLVVTRTDGAVELGSAVPLAGDRLVTNCHVLRGASRIEVETGARLREAHAEVGDAYRDLCFLELPGLQAPPIPLANPDEVRVGLEVVAAGYPGGRFAIGEGAIIGLHSCKCDGGKVIQTSAPFDRGASGGGLFDRQGRLVGILSFKARSGGNFHFAVPAGWLAQAGTSRAPPGAGDASFWERPERDNGYFLMACELGARQDWRPLARLAREWTQQRPDDPEAWMAQGRAERGLGHDEVAAAAFQRALALGPDRAEARLALQQLEFVLGRDLLPQAYP